MADQIPTGWICLSRDLDLVSFFAEKFQKFQCWPLCFAPPTCLLSTSFPVPHLSERFQYKVFHLKFKIWNSASELYWTAYNDLQCKFYTSHLEILRIPPLLTCYSGVDRSITLAEGQQNELTTLRSMPSRCGFSWPNRRVHTATWHSVARSIESEKKNIFRISQSSLLVEKFGSKTFRTLSSSACSVLSIHFNIFRCIVSSRSFANRVARAAQPIEWIHSRWTAVVHRVHSIEEHWGRSLSSSAEEIISSWKSRRRGAENKLESWTNTLNK